MKYIFATSRQSSSIRDRRASNFSNISMEKKKTLPSFAFTLISLVAFPLRCSPWSCLTSSFLPIFSSRLLSKQTVFSKISTDSACYFCFMLLSTKGYDFSTWCISVLNTIEKKTRSQRVEALMKTMSVLVRWPGHLHQCHRMICNFTSHSQHFKDRLYFISCKYRYPFHSCKIFRKQNMEMFSNLNGKRRRKARDWNPCHAQP